jgi:hypothetical protein
MKQILLTLALIGGFAFAQQQATLSGVIKTETAPPAEARVALHVVDRDGLPQEELASVVPIANTFSIQTIAPKPENLSMLRNGSILLPGLQNEYVVSPAEGVNYAVARVNMYIDSNNNQKLDLVVDATYLGIASLEEPIGFFTLIYVDKAATFSGRGIELKFEPGWNIYTVRYPSDADPIYTAQAMVEDIVMDVFLP